MRLYITPSVFDLELPGYYVLNMRNCLWTLGNCNLNNK